MIRVEAPHGTRTRYVQQKCRCDECRAANTKYARERQLRVKEIAFAYEAELAVKWRSKPVFGKRMRVKRVYCMGLNGKGCPHKAFLKKNSAGNVCSFCREGLIRETVHVPAEKTRQHIRLLRKQGIGLRAIQEMTKLSRSMLQDIVAGRQEKVLPETEKRVLEIEVDDPVIELCLDCGLSHHPEDRLKLIARMLPGPHKDIQDAYSCMYGGSAGERKLFRDLHRLGAMTVGQTWALPAQLPEVTTGGTDAGRLHRGEESRGEGRGDGREDREGDPGGGAVRGPPPRAPQLRRGAVREVPRGPEAAAERGGDAG